MKKTFKALCLLGLICFFAGGYIAPKTCHAASMSTSYSYWSGFTTISLLFYFSSITTPSSAGACDIYINGRYYDTYAVTLQNDVIKMPGVGKFYWDEGKDKLVYFPESVQILTLTGGN